jgi:hypothetical protein
MLIFQQIASPPQAYDAKQVHCIMTRYRSRHAAVPAEFTQFMKNGKTISAFHSINAVKIFHSNMEQKLGSGNLAAHRKPRQWRRSPEFRAVENSSKTAFYAASRKPRARLQFLNSPFPALRLTFRCM